jgi:hypothetical protein
MASVYIFAAMKKLLLLFILIAAFSYGYGQSRTPSNSTAPSSLQPGSVDASGKEQKTKASEQKKKTSGNKTTYDARERFYARMEDVAKANRKAEKEMQKPQYSDPSYFGHKKPPVKNPPAKMKYCKECGIRH